MAGQSLAFNKADLLPQFLMPEYRILRLQIIFTKCPEADTDDYQDED